MSLPSALSAYSSRRFWLFIAKSVMVLGGYWIPALMKRGESLAVTAVPYSPILSDIVFWDDVLDLSHFQKSGPPPSPVLGKQNK